MWFRTCSSSQGRLFLTIWVFEKRGPVCSRQSRSFFVDWVKAFSAYGSQMTSKDTHRRIP
jgi:hypothetical protein